MLWDLAHTCAHLLPSLGLSGGSPAPLLAACVLTRDSWSLQGQGSYTQQQQQPLFVRNKQWEGPELYMCVLSMPLAGAHWRA